MNKNNPYFAVVIPLYNKENFIKNTIESVLSQSISNYELIVVDDGSTDNSAVIVRTFNDKRIRLISKENEGVSVARNIGIEHASADYIAFLDADDEWLPDFLETIIQLIYKFPNSGAYATAIKRTDSADTLHKVTYSSLPKHPWEGAIENLFKVIVEDSSPITSSSVCIKKSVFAKVGVFPEGVKRGEDRDMWIRIFLEYSIIFTTSAKAIIHRDKEGGSLAILKTIDEEPYAALELEKRIKSNEVQIAHIKDAQKTISKSLGYRIDDYITTKQYFKALKYLMDKRMNKLPAIKFKLFLKLAYKLLSFKL